MLRALECNKHLFVLVHESPRHWKLIVVIQAEANIDTSRLHGTATVVPAAAIQSQPAILNHDLRTDSRNVRPRRSNAGPSKFVCGVCHKPGDYLFCSKVRVLTPHQPTLAQSSQS